MRKRFAAKMQKALHQHVDLEQIVQIRSSLNKTTNHFRVASGTHRHQQMFGQLGTGQPLVEVLEDRIRWGWQ